MRLAVGISQADLAMAIGGTSSNSVVSKVEAGRQTVDPDTLSSIANALGCTPNYLLGKPPEFVATRPWLRAYADAPARAVEQFTAENCVAHEAFDTLGLKRLPDRIPLFDGDLSDDEAIERFAIDVRAEAGIDADAVVGNMMRAADRLGCVVLPMSSELGRHLGMSQRVDGSPFIRVSRPRDNEPAVPGDRQRFTVAHEIGHLGLHAGEAPPESAEDARRIERQAHRFASAFLAPANPLIEDWQDLGGRVTLSTLAELKGTWGIAIKALVVRFQQLGLIGSDQATSLYKQISKRGWNKGEPVSVTHETPLWASKALRQRVGGHDDHQLAMAAGSAAGMDSALFEKWIDWSPVSDDVELAEVVHLPLRSV